jgi:hypothetical protein
MAACFVPPRGFAPVVGKGLCNAIAFISRRPHPDRTPKLKTNWQPLFRSTVKVTKASRSEFAFGPVGRRGGGRTPALVADWVRTALSEIVRQGMRLWPPSGDGPSSGSPAQRYIDAVSCPAATSESTCHAGNALR